MRLGAGDRGRARATVGLNHVAIDPNGFFPRTLKSAIARKLRPISAESRESFRPLLPRADSRPMRCSDDPGNMPYSEVIQPLPLLRKNCGTRSSSFAVQITLVSPISMNTDPSGVS